jgi:hypothetical protein
MNDYINGVQLKSITTKIIDTDHQDDLRNLPNNSIIWCKTEFIDQVFFEIKNSEYTHKLITHCSDHNIDEFRFSKKPSNIVKWYAQNADYQHEDLIPIPIGIENHQGPHKGNSIDYEYLIQQKIPKISKNKIMDKIYCNFNCNTNSNRINVANILNKIGIFQTSKPFSYYCEDLKKFLFSASPRGNGIDCHRTWESLYMGCIPIVDKHFMYDNYQHLPIIQVENWADVTVDFLMPYIEKYINGELFQNMEETQLSFYKKKIETFT